MIRILFVFLFLISVQAGAAPWTSGEQIPVGTPDGIGPLAPHAVMSVPLGAVKLSDGSFPEIVVATTKYGTESGIWLYRHAGAKDGAPLFEKAHRIAHKHW